MGALAGSGSCSPRRARLPRSRGRRRARPRPRALPDVLPRRASAPTAAGLAVLLALEPTRGRPCGVALVGAAAALAARGHVRARRVEAPGGSADQGARDARRLPRRAQRRAASRLRGPRPAHGPRSRALGARARRRALLAVALVGTALLTARSEPAGASGAERRRGCSRPVQPLRVLARRASTCSPSTRCTAPAPARSATSGCASGRSRKPSATRTRSTSRPPRSSGSSACSRSRCSSAGSPAWRAAPGRAGAVAALALYAAHAGLDWDWEMPALTLVALVLAASLAAARPAAS